MIMSNRILLSFEDREQAAPLVAEDLSGSGGTCIAAAPPHALVRIADVLAAHPVRCVK